MSGCQLQLTVFVCFTGLVSDLEDCSPDFLHAHRLQSKPGIGFEGPIAKSYFNVNIMYCLLQYTT